MAMSVSIALTEKSVSTANNTSSVNCKVTLSWTNGSYNHTGATQVLMFDDVRYTTTAKLNPNKKSSGSQTLFDVTRTVKHNLDGSKTVYANVTVISGGNSGTITKSASKGLTVIAGQPKAPTSFTIDAGHGNYIGYDDTLTMSWFGASGNITGYQIRYSFGNSGWKEFRTMTGIMLKISNFKFEAITDINQTGAGKTIQFAVRALNGSFASAWCYSNKLIISGAMDLKVNGAWKIGTTFIKVNGAWKRVKRVWIKINGSWKESK